ncbi:hypothetical protein TGAM01_v204022, partial [Trichoderma gamsii]
PLGGRRSPSYRWTIELARTRTPADLAVPLSLPKQHLHLQLFASHLRVLTFCRAAVLHLHTRVWRFCLCGAYFLPLRYQRVASSISLGGRS